MVDLIPFGLLAVVGVVVLRLLWNLGSYFSRRF